MYYTFNNAIREIMHEFKEKDLFKNYTTAQMITTLGTFIRIVPNHLNILSDKLYDEYLNN